ncbi:MAG: cytosine permease [[Clostridium] scindens]
MPATISRELKSGFFPLESGGGAYFIAMVPATVLDSGLIGATWLLITVDRYCQPNQCVFQQMAHIIRFCRSQRLIHILFAQMTTNLRRSQRGAAGSRIYGRFQDEATGRQYLVGILAVCTCPWILTNDSSAAGLDMFVKIYTAFFGPIFAVLITDYYILHRGKVEGEKLDDPYDDKGNHAGINPAGYYRNQDWRCYRLINRHFLFMQTIPQEAGILFLREKDAVP